jgi:hypothetical protein
MRSWSGRLRASREERRDAMLDAVLRILICAREARDARPVVGE